MGWTMKTTMKTRNPGWLALAAALAGSLALLGAAAGGDAKGYVFAKPPVNSLGLKNLADLRGKPVLIDFWGTH